MCIVQHVEMKSVFTFQPIKQLVSTTVKSAKPVVTFWIFLLRTKNRRLCCLVVTVHIVYTSHDYEKPYPFLKKLLRQSQPSTTEPETKKVKTSPNIEQTYPFPIGWWFEQHLHFSNHFIQFQSTVNRSSLVCQLTQNHHDLLSLQRRNPVDSRFWTRLCYYCSKRSQPKYNNQFTKNTPISRAIVVGSKTRLFEQSSSASSNYSQPRGINGDERRSTLQCGSSRLGH